MRVARLFTFAAVALALAVAVLVVASPDAMAAVLPMKGDALSRLVDLGSVHASGAILALRREIADLVAKAEAKAAEAVDGMTADQLRAIETEHSQLTTEIASKRSSLAQLEAAPPALTADQLEADRARAAEIQSIGTRAGLAATAIADAIRTGQTVDAFRAVAFDHMASASERAVPRTTIIRDEGDTTRAAMQEAITVALAYAGGERNAQVSDNGRRFMGYGLAEIAAEHIGERRMPRTVRDREDVFSRAFHSTSDFPLLFGAAINSRLGAAYQAMAPVYRRIAVRNDYNDFRNHNVLQVGGFPALQPVGEGGEIKFGTFGESQEVTAVGAYAVQFALTRQMLVNDNLGMIDRVLSSYAGKVALFEERTFFAIKGVASGAGPTLVQTARPVFNTTDGTLAASATAITNAALSLGRAAIRKQKDLSGDEMGNAPSILLVGPDKETEAETILAAIVAAQASNVNVFSGKLSIAVSSKMTGNAWELYTDPSVGANWTWGLLNGYDAPRLRMDDKFGVQGVGVSLEHDFGAGAIDFRYGYRNAGA